MFAFETLMPIGVLIVNFPTRLDPIRPVPADRANFPGSGRNY